TTEQDDPCTAATCVYTCSVHLGFPRQKRFCSLYTSVKGPKRKLLVSACPAAGRFGGFFRSFPVRLFLSSCWGGEEGEVCLSGDGRGIAVLYVGHGFRTQDVPLLRRPAVA
ncbi:unnamed protein product, partial [Ectocarpus fasciculatus]